MDCSALASPLVVALIGLVVVVVVVTFWDKLLDSVARVV